MSKRDAMDWRCRCEVEFRTKAEAVAHCRKEHQDDPYCAWDQFGDVGDTFANGAMEVIHGKLLRQAAKHSEEIADLKAKAQAYDELAPRYYSRTLALGIVANALKMIDER